MAEHTEIVPLPDEKRQSLFRWNLGTAIFHLITSIVIFAITDTKNYALVFTTYSSDRGNPQDWQPVLADRGRAVIGYFSGVFLLLASLDHFLVAFVFRGLYEKKLAVAQNPFRWFEYSVSASVMRVQIALLSGLLDLHLLLAIFGLTASTMLFGFIQERMEAHLQGQPQKRTLLAFWIGFIPHVFSWGIVASYFFHATSTGSPPGFVWAIIFILFFLDLSFAVNMFLQQKEIGRWSNYLYGEYAFLILSLISKQLLAWINYGGSNSLTD